MSQEPIDPSTLTGQGTPSRRAGQAQPSTPPGLVHGVGVIQIVANQTYATRGGGASDEVAIPVGPVFKRIGPLLDDIVVHAGVKDASATLSLRFELEYSMDGETWSTDTVLPTQTGSGYYISAVYTDRTKFGLMMRFKLVLTDAGTVQSGTFTIDVAMHFLS